MAINYMWRYFDHGTTQIQASVTSAIDGKSYAVGYGSVDWLRATDYMSSRWTMLIHTTFGGLALALAILQFVPAIRRRWTGVHRWSGRAFVLCMTICMVSAMVFLVVGGVPHFNLAPGFWLQLWALALGTLLAGWTAVAMIRRRNLVAHQGLMMMCFALLFTAPGLRVLWIAFHPLFPRLILIENLGGAAISEAVLAPALGVAGFILTRPQKAGGATDAWARPAYLWGLVVGIVAVGGTAIRFLLTIPSGIPTALLWVYAVPLAIAITGCLLFARRAYNAGRHIEERRWRILFLGVVASVPAANLTWLAGTIASSNTDSMLASMMVTTAVPIALAGMVIIDQAAPRTILQTLRARQSAANSA
jgi:hypothetical protein